MKKLTVLVAALLLLTFNTQAQNIDSRKFIEVTGSAEMLLQPDEIELEITLQEYDQSGKKVKLDDVNNGFIKVLQKNNVDTKALEFVKIDDNYWWYWWQHRSTTYQTKTVTIKLLKTTNIINLVEALNEKWVQGIRISKSTNFNIQEHRKEVKIEAAKAAKTKATYLMESLGEELGNVLSVEEIPETNNDYWYKPANVFSNANLSIQSDANDNAVNNVAKIKLRYEIKIKFAIK
ncbi:MAG: SIMPL domain-containing protein [Flavobacterium sp.]